MKKITLLFIILSLNVVSYYYGYNQAPKVEPINTVSKRDAVKILLKDPKSTIIRCQIQALDLTHGRLISLRSPYGENDEVYILGAFL